MIFLEVLVPKFLVCYILFTFIGGLKLILMYYCKCQETNFHDQINQEEKKKNLKRRNGKFSNLKVAYTRGINDKTKQKLSKCKTNLSLYELETFIFHYRLSKSFEIKTYFGFCPQPVCSRR